MTDNITIAAVIVLLVLLALPTIRDIAGSLKLNRADSKNPPA